MSKDRTRLLGILAMGFSLVGVFGMVLMYRGALSPAVAPSLIGIEGIEGGVEIGKLLDGRTLKMDIVGAAGKGLFFLCFGMIWVIGAIMLRTILGWGDLACESRRIKLLGIAGAVFQLLGSIMFLYSALVIIQTFDAIKVSNGQSPEMLTSNFGATLRSTLSGLTTFALGNVMSVIFIWMVIQGRSDNPPARKRKIVSSLSFVPMLIATLAIINAMILLAKPDAMKGPVYAALILGMALPMAVGSIPLLVNSKSIPRG